MKKLLPQILLLLILQSPCAEFTIHVLNPWMEDTDAARRDSLRMAGNAEVGYYPGSSMVNEGGGWFYYTYTEVSKGDNVTFTITTWIGPEVWRGKVDYGRDIDIDSLFADVSVSAEDIWIVLNPDSTQFPTVYEFPPNGKTVHLLNPWPESSPKMIVNGGPPMQMRLHKELCGWYSFYYAGPPDSLHSVTFTDYYEKETYSSAGLTAGEGSDLSALLLEHDTVYLVPRPFPSGSPALSSTFPGRLGDCNTRKVSGIFRDWKLDNESFFNNPMGASSGHKNMIMPTLTAPEYKPRLTDDPAANTLNSTKLESWFETDTFPDGTTNDTCIDLYMTKGYDGRWTFDSDDMRGFFPLDDFNNPNNIKYLDKVNENDADGKMHNFHFSMEMHMQFIYREGIGLEFYFRGDDDVWIFVNNTLAIDLGGLNNKAKDTLYLDQDKETLGLIDGEIYNMDIFFAERNPVGSNLLIKTTMDLRNSSALYSKEFFVDSGITQYDIWQQVQTAQNDCGLTRLTDGEEPSDVDFFIEGPQFSEATLLETGLSYGGIQVDENGYRVIIDSVHLKDLLPGDYRITFISTYDKDRSGYLTFAVPRTPDHLDVLPDTIQLDLAQDMPVDSLYMDIATDSLQLYTVVRDEYGAYIEDGTALTWSSSNDDVVTVVPSATDSARAMIHKADGGTAWIFVHQGTLKGDSILIMAEAKPDWPLIVSGIIAGSSGDIVPDMVYLTLTDTFSTGQTLTGVELSYRGNVYSIPAAECHSTGTSISFSFSTLTGPDARPSGDATIVVDVKGEAQRHTRELTDGIGPVLIAAELFEKNESEPDILHLTFSEKIFPTTLIGEQLQRIISATADTTVLKALRIESIVNDSTLSVVLSATTQAVHPGELLRLVPGAAGGTVSDAAGNLPHLLNPSVVIGFRKGAAPIKNAWYKDIDANGVIDLLVIHFNRQVAVSELDTLRLHWNTGSHVIDPGLLNSAGDSLITVHLEGTVIDTTEISTGGAMFIAQTFRAIPGVMRTAQAIDSAAPVLTATTLKAGGYSQSGTKLPDTLAVSFSEPVHIDGTQPFVLAAPGSSTTYRFNVTIPGFIREDATFITGTTDPLDASPAQGDSIWINTATYVADSGFMYQTNPRNRHVPLTITFPPVEWRVQIAPNPFNNRYETQHIRVAPEMPIHLTGFRMTCAIFDGVGNLVVGISDMSIEDSAFVKRWDGTNTHGRFVGSGTYLAVIRVYDEKGMVFTARVPAGVSFTER